MALIVSAASGNFNAGATWVGGVVPGVGDEAQAANGHTITITANATCAEISNAGTGLFILNNGVTLTANVTNKSTTALRDCLQFTAASPAVGNIVGDCTGGASMSSGAASAAARNTGTGTLNITGNCTGGTGQAAWGVGNGSTGTLTITGNCTGGSVFTSAIAANNVTTGVMNITGTCTGGSATAGYGANNNSAGTLNITGTCTGGSATGIFGALNNSSGTMLVVGTIEASEFAAGVSGTNRAQVTLLTGPFLISPTFGVNPIACTAWRWASALNDQTYLEVGTQTLLEKRNLVTPDNATNFPTASDVRSGTAYGIGGVVFGTCVVPSPAQVAAGTPVDDTVGTLAAASASDIATAVRSELSVELGRLDASISSRLAPSGTLATVTNLTNAPASVTPTDIWSHATRTITGGTVDTLTNAPTVPSAASIRAEIDSNSTQLAAIKAKTDLLPASPAATGDIPTADITAIKSKTDSLPASPAAVSDIPTTAQIATAVEGSLLNEADGSAVLNAIVSAIGNTNLSEVSLVAAVRADLERNGGKLINLDAAISSRLAAADYSAPTSAPTAASVATAVWSAATKEITGGTVDTLTNAPTVPSAASIRAEIDSNSTQLAAIKAKTDLLPASPAATGDIPTADITAIKGKTDLLNTDRLGQCSTVATTGAQLAAALS